MGCHIFVWESQSLFSKGKFAWPQWFGCHVRVGFFKLYPDRVHWCVTCCSWVWVQSDVYFRPNTHRSEGCGCSLFWHCGVFNPVFLCTECQGDLIGHMEGPTAVGKFAAFSVKIVSPFWRMCVHFSSPLGVVKYSQDRMPKKNAPMISCLIAVFKCVFVRL